MSWCVLVTRPGEDLAVVGAFHQEWRAMQVVTRIKTVSDRAGVDVGVWAKEMLPEREMQEEIRRTAPAEEVA